MQPEEVPKANGVKNEADVSPPPEIGLIAAALPALETVAESIVEDAPQSGIRRIVPGPGTAASGATGVAALVGAAVGGVVFFWDTNTSAKRWMDEIDPTTGEVYKSQEEYSQNSPEIGGMRARRQQPHNLGPLADPWAEVGPGAPRARAIHATLFPWIDAETWVITSRMTAEQER